MAKGGAGLRAAHAKTLKGLAWASFAIAIAAGAMLPGTFVGSLVATVLNALPDAYGIQTIAKILILVFGWLGVLLDCYVKLEPNQLAVIGVLLLPSVAATTGGGLAEWTLGLANAVLGFLDSLFGAAVPSGAGSTATAVAAAAAALIMSQRVVRK